MLKNAIAVSQRGTDGINKYASNTSFGNNLTIRPRNAKLCWVGPTSFMAMELDPHRLYFTLNFLENP